LERTPAGTAAGNTKKHLTSKFEEIKEEGSKLQQQRHLTGMSSLL